MTKRRLRPTFLLRLIVLVLSVALFAGVALLLLPGTPVWMLGAIFLAWVAAIEVGVLPAALEWWAVKRAASEHGVLRSRLLTYDADVVDAREREERRADVDGNPSLW
jgi:hypothetical protein